MAAQIAERPRTLERSPLALWRDRLPEQASIEKLAGLKAWAAAQVPAAAVSAEFARRMERTGDFYGTWTLERLPQTHFYALHSVNGTMHCYSSLYFEIKNGEIVSQQSPPGIQSEETGGCMVSREFGVIDQTPVMFEELYTRGPEMTSWLTIAAWRNGRFVDSCRISFEYEFALDAAGSNTAGNCAQDQCGRLRRAARTLVADVQRNPIDARRRYFEALAPSSREHWAAGYSSVENLGLESDQTNPAHLTQEVPLRLPYVDDDRLYVVSLGHTTIGWRYFAEWQVVFHELIDGQPIKRATFEVGMWKGAIKTTTISVAP